MRRVVPILVLLAVPAIVVGQKLAARDGRRGRGPGRQGGPTSAAAAGRLAHPAGR